MKGTVRLGAIVIVACLTGSCSNETSSDANGSATATRTITRNGGTLSVGGARLTIPAGALSSPTEISMTKTRAAPPRGYTAYSPVYTFRPDGLVFAKPAEVSIPFDGNADLAAVYWSTSGDGFERLVSDVAGETVSAEVAHFSSGFAGASDPRADGGAADAGTSTPDPAWNQAWGPYAGFVSFELTFNGAFLYGNVSIPSPAPESCTLPPCTAGGAVWRLRAGQALGTDEFSGTCMPELTDPAAERTCMWRLPANNDGIFLVMQPPGAEFVSYAVVPTSVDKTCTEQLLECDPNTGCRAPADSRSGARTLSCNFFVPTGDPSRVSVVWARAGDETDSGSGGSGGAGGSSSTSGGRPGSGGSGGAVPDGSAPSGGSSGCDGGPCRPKTLAGPSRFIGLAVNAGTVYWADGAAGAIMKVSSEGGTPVSVARAQPWAGPVVDANSVYWAEGAGTITKAPLAGGAPKALISGLPSALGQIHGIAVGSGKVYWSTIYDGPGPLGAVRSVSVNGGTVDTLADVQQFALDVAVDATHIYWTIGDGDGGPVTPDLKKMAFADRLQVSVEVGPDANLVSLRGLAVDSSYIYWTAGIASSRSIQRVPLAGGNATTLVSGQNGAYGTALDSEYIYWTTSDAGTVMRAPLGGGNAQTLATGQNHPSSIKVDSTNVYWIDAGTYPDYTDGWLMTVPKLP